MIRKLFALVPPFLFVIAGAAQTPQPSSFRDLIAPRYADTVLYNGTVLTLDDRDTVGQAVAVRDGRILAVGDTTAILELAGAQTVKVDLQGKTVMPGIINTHSHPQRYVASHYWNYIPRQYQELIRADVLAESFDTKDAVLAHLRRIVERSTHPAREWIRVNWLVLEEEIQDKNELYTEPKSDALFFAITKEDLDRISPEKPFVMRREIYSPDKDRSWAVMNSKGLALFAERYGNLLNLDPKTHTGHVSGYLYEMLYDEVLPHLPRAEVLLPLYKRELLEWFAPVGVTTVATRLKAYHIATFSELDVRDEMPLRVAYGHEIGRYNPFFERDLHRGLGTIVGSGSDMFWMVGISIEQPDSSPNSGLCSSFSKVKVRSNDPYPDGRCHWDLPGNRGRQTATILTKLGYRVAGTHTQGDKGYEMMIDTVVAAAGGVDAARATRPILEHGTMANPSMIKKAAAIGAIWSTQPGDIPEGRHEFTAEVYGKEVADRMFMPTRAMLDAGITVSWESGGTDGYDNPESKRRPFVGMEIFVTRKDRNGVVRAPRERIDRKTALRILTRGGASYVLREKELGSLEPGKHADFIVLDRNPLDPSFADEDLSQIQVLMTFSGGRVVFDAATFKLPPDDVRHAKDGRSFIDNETE